MGQIIYFMGRVYDVIQPDLRADRRRRCNWTTAYNLARDHRRYRSAAAKVREILNRPDDPDCELDIYEGFNPWDILPSISGFHDPELNICAIEVLTDILEGKWCRKDVGASILRQMFCALELCDYYDNANDCWPTPEFAPLLPELIDRWTVFLEQMFGDKEPNASQCVPSI